MVRVEKHVLLVFFFLRAEEKHTVAVLTGIDFVQRWALQENTCIEMGSVS